MATEFTIYQIESKTKIEDLPYTNEFKTCRNIFTERRPLSEFYDIRDTLWNKNKHGDDYVEILPEDYELFKEYVNLLEYKKSGYTFICVII